VAGVVIGGIGLDAIRHVRQRSDLPLACLPVLLGAHQLVEAFVWWGLYGSIPHGLGRAAMWTYLVIAFVVIPVFVPLTVGSLESGRRRLSSLLFVVLGAVVATTLAHAMWRGPVSATIEDRHIRYGVHLAQGGLVVAIYVAATCGSMLWSRRAEIRWFGAANLVAVGLLAWLSTSGFVSLWCMWAAVTSVAIAAFLRDGRSAPVTASVAADH